MSHEGTQPVSNDPQYPPQGQQMYAPPTQNYQFAQAPQEVAPLKHSGLGIFSTITAVLCGIGTVATIVIAGVIATNDPMALEDDSSPLAAIIGLGIIGCMFGLVVGAALGIGGLVQPRRKKVFAIIGLVLNGLALLGVCGVMALGFAVQASEGGY